MSMDHTKWDMFSHLFTAHSIERWKASHLPNFCNSAIKNSKGLDMKKIAVNIHPKEQRQRKSKEKAQHEMMAVHLTGLWVAV